MNKLLPGYDARKADLHRVLGEGAQRWDGKTFLTWLPTGEKLSLIHI